MGRWPAPWPTSVHLIGVGGVAMSSLAVLLARRGVSVTGSDRDVYPPASELLARAGIEPRTPYSPSNLPSRPDLVIVGNAVSPGNEELDAVLERDWPLASMAEVVERLLVPGRRPLVVAGTHGKTTTASLLAWLLHDGGRDPSFLVGGLPGNFDCGSRLGGGPDLVLEGDEYDTAFFDKGPKFLHYWPRIAVLGTVEFDHADIYRDADEVTRAFSWLVRLVPRDGTLVYDADDAAAARLAAAARCRRIAVGLAADADLSLADREDRSGGQRFTVLAGGKPAGAVRLALPGVHNAKNALAALAAARAAGLPLERALASLPRFRPPRRRMERVGEGRGVVVYDDFAHHPTAVRLTLEAARSLVPAGGRLVACLEPRSNTMVRAIVRAPLEDALSRADRVVLGPVDRPERFAPEERLDVASLAAGLRSRGVPADGPLPPERIADLLLGELAPGDRVVVMSNGGFGGLARRLVERLRG
ncbi:MAG: hypothetical protein D6718_08440 [Acidobacteria bacterium]|nr:MAG: hypothetical protein D6718_08440 [Acidobacteriota bacterium]